MKPKTIILMVVAIGCGLAASYMTSKLLADRSTPPAVENKVKVLIATRKIPPYEAIREPEKFFVEKEVVEGTYPTKCLKSFDEVRNQRLSKVKNEEETVFKEDLLSRDAGGPSIMLPEGQRAIAIKVNPEALVGGFVLPGFRVDLIATLTNDKGELAAETIMQNMLVLAIDMNWNRDSDKQTMLGSTVTFAVTPEEAMRLSVATRATDIRLVLRPPGDNGKNNLPPSKLYDWRKPAHETDSGPDGSGTGGDGDATPGSLTSLGKPKKGGTEVLTVDPKKTDETPVVKVEVPAPVTHTLTILNGEYQQKAIFIKQENGEWARGSSDQGDEQPGHPKGTQPVPPGREKIGQGPAKAGE